MCPDSIWKIVWCLNGHTREEFVEAQDLERAIIKWKQVERGMSPDHRLVSVSRVEVIK